MNQPVPSIENVRDRLTQARNNPKRRRNFPKDLWRDIFSLIREYSFTEICQKLELSPYLVANKIGEKPSKDENSVGCRKNTPYSEPPLKTEKEVAFREVFCSPPPPPTNIVIEISRLDLRARIEGPISCLDALKGLFKES